ncbi:MAG: sigma-54-dependent Fis family transcriptional regulator [Archangium sp.]|nr:sigma-54-dependent Fis family transcriptional regulator [Archangium sp.]
MLATLLVDDDRAFSTVAAAALAREGFPVQVVHSLHEARRAVAAKGFDLVLLDRRLPDGDGLAWLPELKQLLPAAQVVVVTAHGDIASAVEAIRLGAADYVAKPVELADVVMKSKRAAEDIRLRDRLQLAEGTLSSRRALVPPVSKVMTALLETLERIAATSPRSPVLLLGETGVGKEVLAWHLHTRSVGPAAPFVHVNCAALPEAMAESELFGHEKGAFTDATSTRRGLVELANGGTLFLDEVGELSPALQAKVLTFLDSGRFRRVGGAAELSSVARVVAATNRDLEARVREGTFREDLWFRLSVFRLEIPPLRERREDVPALVMGLLARIAAEQGRRRTITVSAEGLARLAAYRFPGNVRELRNVLERAAVLETGPELKLDWLSTPAGGASGDGFVMPSGATLEELEKKYARWVLAKLDGRRLDTSKALGISHPTLAKLLKDPE